MFDHLTAQDFLVCFSGILMFWFFRFSSDKDEDFDDKKKPANEMGQFVRVWMKTWFVYKWDNIVAHVFASIFFLWIGEENIADWLGQLADKIPMGANEIGTSASIGFFGSFLAEGLKKLIKLIKT